MMVSEELSKILACPDCHTPVERHHDDLVCSQCRRSFEVIANVPVMLRQESQSQLQKFAEAAENTALRDKLAQRPWMQKLVMALRPPHPFFFKGARANREKLCALLEKLSPNPVTVDVGSGIRGKTNLKGMSPKVLNGLIGLDIGYTSHLGVIADAHHLPFGDGTVHGVIIQGVLEHVADPDAIVREVQRVLRPGGAVYVETPFVQHYHQDPEDFRRYTLAGLRQLLGEFQETSAGVSAGPASGLCDMMSEFPAVWFKNPHMYWAIKWLTGWLVWPISWLDFFGAGRKRSHFMAGALFFMGTKSTALKHET